ncbi:MAG: PAS domain S-box protein [Desulfobacterota bacterium]|nr:PAS domain S-box protein [Thermodesulfobacteriota bacterium]
MKPNGKAQNHPENPDPSLASILDDIPALICRFLPDGTLTLVNKTYCDYFGKRKEDLLGRDFFQFIPDSERETVRSHFLSLTVEEPLCTYEHQVIAPDGSLHWQQWTDRALADEKGVVKEYQSIGFDISRRRSMEAKLQESEARTQALLDASSEVAFLIDNRGNLLAFNKTFCMRFGKSAEELLGKNILDLLPPDLAKAKKILGQEVIQSRKPLRYKDQMAGFLLEHSICLVLNAKGEVVQLAVFSRDITQEEEMKMAIQEREKNLQSKSKTLEELNVALKVLLEKRTQDREELEERVVSNIKLLIEPYVDKLAGSGPTEKQSAYLEILRSHLNDIASPLARRLSSDQYHLTPKEMHVAMLIKEGKTTKEIAEMMHSSSRTIEFHRENLRRKLDLRNRKSNLRSRLLALP